MRVGYFPAVGGADISPMLDFLKPCPRWCAPSTVGLHYCQGRIAPSGSDIPGLSGAWQMLTTAISLFHQWGASPYSITETERRRPASRLYPTNPCEGRGCT